MDGAFPVLQQDTVTIPAHGREPDDGDSGILADVEHAVFLIELDGRDVQLPGQPENIHGTEDDILPVGAALAALIAVELEGVVQANGHGVDIFDHFV